VGRWSGIVFCVELDIIYENLALIPHPSFFILGFFEANPPRRLSWLLAYDLMDLIWMLFRKFSLTTPQYRTDEKQLERQRNNLVSYPPITGYRLLTSASVTFFGLTKAYLSYHGLSGEANTVDWILGVVLASR